MDVRADKLFFDSFAAPGDALAVATADTTITYGELDKRIDDRLDELGDGRRLVLIESSNELEPLITYLAALRGRHPVMILAADKPDAAIIDQYRPDVIFSEDQATGDWGVRHIHPQSIHSFHPDLALLLSTSGSTGTSKFVRLSYENLAANADSIAQYLEIRPTDRASASLPLHYCYGLSIVHSHLLVGAGLILTDNSVVDPCFWKQFNDHGGTTFPAVPFTFELLDRIDFASMDVPTLRYITQAGGRLAPEQVRRYAELGVDKGFDLFVMYGATEATARMAFLPPHMAAANPTVIGQPIPDGSFDIADDGELIYSGPNVMLGYAEGPEDLALGRSIDALNTGDLARQTDDGLYEIVGRKSRFLKMFGLRISLDTVEAFTREYGCPAHATGTDDLLVLATEDREASQGLGEAAAKRFGLPLTSVHVEPYDEVPRLSSGKVDYPTIRDAALAHHTTTAIASQTAGSVAEIFGTTLGRADVGPQDTFVSLGGDSLSYIEASLALEAHLGHVPDGWHLTPVGDLDRVQHRNSMLRQVETNVVIRAVAILFILGSHFELFDIEGGAHVLLAVAGFNFSRFLLNRIMAIDSVTPVLGTVARIAIPTVGWIALTQLAKGSFDPAVFFLVSSYWRVSDGGYWFIEILLQLLMLVAVVLAFPQVRRIHRISPYRFAVGVLVVALIARFAGDAIWDTTPIGFKVPHMTLWLFALGWVADQSRDVNQRLALSAATVLTVPGFFDSTQRTLVMVGGILLLIWIPKMSMPLPLNRVVGMIGGASLYLYLVHFQVNTVLGVDQPFLKLIVAVVFGLIAAAISERVMREGERRIRARVSARSTESETVG